MFPNAKTTKLALVIGGIVLVGLVVWCYQRFQLSQTRPSQRPGQEEVAAALNQRTKKCPRCFLVNYDVMVDIPGICKDGGVTLVIAIHVNAEKFVAREVIRNTWLSEVRGSRKFKHVRYFFLLGRSDSQDVSRSVRDESLLYGDIVQYDFEDTYKNLTIKTVLALQWIYSRCPSSRFFFKTDDDVWVNVTNLLTTLQVHGKDLEMAMGGVCRKVTVVRNMASKWRATYEEFPGEVYDPYCSGTGYVGGMAVAKGVVNVYTQVPYFHLEDVFIGMCLKLIGYQTKYLEHFDNTRGPEMDACTIKLDGFVTVHKRLQSHMSYMLPPWPQRTPVSYVLHVTPVAPEDSSLICPTCCPRGPRRLQSHMSSV
ncbi:Beta-1,3-galactosyltransferase 5 [Bulinus truncatus]|nr:Beta-1,3-galactosyltransferase 5 [Bulinus truncatus]